MVTVTEGMPESPTWVKGVPGSGAYGRVRALWQGQVADRLEPALDQAGMLPPKAYRHDFACWWEPLGGAV